MKGTPEHDAYLLEAQKTNTLYQNYINAFDEQKFLNFNSFQQFLGEFGVWFAVFIYSLFNLILTFYRKHKGFVADAFLHTTIITVTLFYLRWCFKGGDYLSIDYVLANILTSAMIIASVYFFVKMKRDMLKKRKQLEADTIEFMVTTREIIAATTK